MKFSLSIENINYLKIGYKDDDDFTHCAKVAIKSLGVREIHATAKFGEGIEVETPQEVELGFACDNGLYKAKSILKYVERCEDDVFLFVVQTPEEVDYYQNREYFRVKLNENATIVCKDGDKNRNYACETHDLSANGVSLILDRNYKIPEDVELIFYLPKKQVRVSAKRVRIDNEDNKYKYSFNFIGLDESDLDYISQICLKKQLEIRRKSLM